MPAGGGQRGGGRARIVGRGADRPGLDALGVDHGEAQRTGIDAQVNLVPVRLVKGIELDSVVVVEPARIVAEEPQGLRSLYVALTWATQRFAVVHAEPLPSMLTDPAD